jgi:DNA-binding response OmpR family regulator
MHKIAIIEDEHVIAEMYKMKLSNDGYQVEVANNGAEGFDLIKAFSPDLVLLDLRMPEMSGDEMLEKVRQTSWGSKPRVIVLTNISRDEAPSTLRFLGVDRYVVKAHHTPAQVVSIVEEILG